MPSSAQGAPDSAAADRGRSAEHLLIGLSVTAAAVLGSALAARVCAPRADDPEADAPAIEPSGLQPSRQVFSLVWPPLFLALTVSGLRIWNAPRSPARTQALTLWGAVQALNALWMALGPRRLGGPLAAAIASLGASAAYVWRARRVEPPARRLAAPYMGWLGVAGALTEELWRRAPPKPTIH